MLCACNASGEAHFHQRKTIPWAPKMKCAKFHLDRTNIVGSRDDIKIRIHGQP